MVNDKQLSYIFMVGKSDSKYLNKQLETEGKNIILCRSFWNHRRWSIAHRDNTYLNLGRDKQDILVGDFIDHYQNLTLKSMLGIQWFNNECDRSDNFMRTVFMSKLQCDCDGVRFCLVRSYKSFENQLKHRRRRFSKIGPDIKLH